MKLSQTLLALGAVVFASAGSTNNFFSELAEKAVDSSSWNFDAGESVCNVYGDPHTKTYGGETINFQGVGEVLVGGVDKELTGSDNHVYATATFAKDPAASNGESYVTAAGFHCGGYTMITRAPIRAGEAPGVYFFDPEGNKTDAVSFTAALGVGSNALTSTNDDLFLYTSCPVSDGIVKLFVKYHINAQNTPVMNLHLAIPDTILSYPSDGYGLCQTKDHGSEFCGRCNECIPITWGPAFQSNDCGPCSFVAGGLAGLSPGNLNEEWTPLITEYAQDVDSIFIPTPPAYGSGGVCAAN